MSEEQTRDAQATDDADAAASDSTDDPNESTEGLLDEQELREHAVDVDRQIQEARTRNPYVSPDASEDHELGTEDADISGPVPGDD